MHKTMSLVLSVAAFGALTGVAQATKFYGNCDDIAGTATFNPNGVGAQAADTTYAFAGTAHCTGAVGDQKLDSAPVHIHVSGPANVSCTSGKSTGDGNGTITLDSSGQTVPFLMTFTATGSEVTIAIKGIAAGSGTGKASFLDRTNPSNNFTTLSNCAPGGQGNKSLSFTAQADVTKDQALDDGQNGSQPSDGAGAGQQSGAQPQQNTPPSDSTSPQTSGSSTPGEPRPKPRPKKHGRHKAKGHHKAKHRGRHKAKGRKKH